MTTQDEQRIQGHDCGIIALRAVRRAMVEKSLITGDDRQDHENSGNDVNYAKYE